MRVVGTADKEIPYFFRLIRIFKLFHHMFKLRLINFEVRKLKYNILYKI